MPKVQIKPENNSYKTNLVTRIIQPNSEVLEYNIYENIYISQT